MYEAVDAEGDEGKDEEEYDDDDSDHVVLFHHLGGCREGRRRRTESEPRWRGGSWKGRVVRGVVGGSAARAMAKERRV